MGKISNFIMKVFGLFGHSENDVVNVRESKDILTNKTIYNELVSLFEIKLEELSVGERMIYPMTFNVILHSSDYQALKGTLPLVFEEVVKQFGKIISKYTEKYPKNLNPARNWTFQVSGSSDDIPLTDDDVLEIRKGSINIMEVGIFHEGVSNEFDNEQGAQNVRVTVKPRNSKVYKNLNVNDKVYTNIFSLAEGIIQYPFDKSVLSPNNTSYSQQDSHYKQNTAPYTDNSVDSSNVHGNAIARLYYFKDGKRHSYDIKTNLVHISGMNDQRKDDSIFHVESTKVKDSHVQIRYLPNEQKFQIIAYGPVRLNQTNMAKSSGAENGWIPLPNNSSIFINDELSVKFLIIK